ncbi:MAG TPA: peptide-methionine (S)-S-oxide reductase MsrA [Prosthecobacter sp.]
MKTFATLLLALMATLSSQAQAADAPAAAPSGKTETAIIGGGCFWCVEAQYLMVKGVKKVVSGYAGGQKDNPTYEEVCEGTTGHAEVIKIDFDPAVVTYKEIIDLFWDAHDPTSVTKEDMYKHGKFLPKGTAYQGNDYGSQYRSAIYTTTDEQLKIAQESKAAAQKNWKDPIATEIAPLKKFYPAEDYHQNFQARNPYQGYVQGVVTPKAEKFKHKLEEKGKIKPEAK